MQISRSNYRYLLKNIEKAIETGRTNALSLLNEQMLLTYWQIGRHIVEFEQKGKQKATYGNTLLSNLSRDLKHNYGKGFSKSNLYLMRLFYQAYPKFQTSGIFQTSGKSPKRPRRKQKHCILSWSHYSELLGISDDMARIFYEQQAIKEN